MQGNFVRWGKACCAVGAMALIGSGSALAGGITCQPAPLTRSVCQPEPVCETKPTYVSTPSCYTPPPCYTPPVCYRPPVCEPKPRCEPPKPVCEWDKSCLRNKVTEIFKAVSCFQEKLRCSRRLDTRVYCAAAKVFTSLILLKCTTSDCNADYERAICNVEKAICTLEEAVKCSNNCAWIEAVRKLKCQVKELWDCKRNGDANGTPV